MSSRRLLLPLIATALLTVSCGNTSHLDSLSSTVPAANTGVTDPPGVKAQAVAADYTVFEIQDTLYVIPEQGDAWFLEQFPTAVPVPRARIIYPDGSEQVTDLSGNFDSSKSSYAAGNPLDRVNVPIEVVSPDGMLVTQSEVIAPTPEQEAQMVSGFIPVDAQPDEPPIPGYASDAEVRSQGGYIWSNDPRDYLAFRTRQDVIHDTIYASWASRPSADALEAIPNKALRMEFDCYNRAVWFTPHAHWTNTDQRVPDEEALLFIYWSADLVKTWEPQRWYVSVLKQPGRPKLHKRAAIWVSPNAYFFSQNIHLAIVEL